MLFLFVCLLVAATARVSAEKVIFSVFVDVNGEAKIKTGEIDSVNANAYGIYNSNSSVNGWNYLDVNANSRPSSVAHHLTNMYAVGFAEGYATCNEIRTFWPNYYKDLFGSLDTAPGPKTVAFIKAQWEWMGMMIEKNAASDPFWFAQQQTRRQLEGMLAGYQGGCLATPTSSTASAASSTDNDAPDTNAFWNTFDTPSMMHLLLINAWGDLYQITVKMKEPGQFSRLHGRNKDQLVERCSAFVRPLPDLSDVFFGHNTWDSFQSLGPRIFKNYQFPLWSQGPGHGKGPGDNDEDFIGYTTLFSSSPALISSIDDFFVVKGVGHLGVQETTNSLYNLEVLNEIKPETVLSWQRSTAANQLSRNGQEWAQNFATLSSGTYTNQWMVVDMNLFTPKQALPANFFWVFEEVPGLTHAEDMTSILVQQTYWPSYNNPYFTDIREAAGYTRLCERGVYGDCYEGAPRWTIFKTQHDSVVDLESMQHIMRFNDYENDPASQGDGCNSIACRGDLQANPSKVGAFGALDAKISSVMLNKASSTSSAGARAYAILGPTQQDQPVFCWSTMPNGDSYSHAGQPDCFDYEWIQLPPKE